MFVGPSLFWQTFLDIQIINDFTNFVRISFSKTNRRIAWPRFYLFNTCVFVISINCSQYRIDIDIL